MAQSSDQQQRVPAPFHEWRGGADRAPQQPARRRSGPQARQELSPPALRCLFRDHTHQKYGIQNGIPEVVGPPGGEFDPLDDKDRDNDEDFDDQPALSDQEQSRARSLG